MMLLFFIICIIFFLMIVFPIFVGIVTSWRKNEPMFIQKSNTRDPRYFAVSFKKIIDKAWASYDHSGILKLSKDEEVIEADTAEWIYNESCKSLVYAESKDFVPKEGIVFEKEIYAKRNAKLEKIPLVRAIACMRDLTLGEGTRVIRWADAQGILIAHDNCDLGLSTTSATKLLIGKNCFFKRLYAPKIWLGLNKEKLHLFNNVTLPREVIINDEIIRNIEYVDDDIVDEKGILQRTIITKHNITVLSNFIVHGHITSYKGVKIDNNAVVHGNIFAEGNIFIGDNAVVLGVVFTQEDIYIGDGAVIGQPNKIKSVVARGNIEFGSNCKVFGYIGTEGIGWICNEI